MTHDIPTIAKSGKRLDREQAISLATVEFGPELSAAAAELRDSGFGSAISYSRKVFIPLTHLCRDVCHYCTFAEPPKRGEAAYMSIEKVLDTRQKMARVVDGQNAGDPLYRPMAPSFDGIAFDESDQMNLKGTFMPFFIISRVIGEIPIIGDILSNGKNSGLIGITYRLRGAANNPGIAVNPLSVVAPGIFREIFEFKN